MKILFLGNSHTAGNDLPAMVKRLAESDGTNRVVVAEMQTTAFLEDIATNEAILKSIRAEKRFAIVLQGLKMSSSHKYEYDHSGALTVGKLVKKHSSFPLLFAEWPRKDWDEADWIIGQYRPISAATQLPIATIGRAWTPVTKEYPSLKLWQPDGNHATVEGTYLAACGLYYKLFGTSKEPSWKPASLDSKVASRLRFHAKQAVGVVRSK